MSLQRFRKDFSEAAEIWAWKVEVSDDILRNMTVRHIGLGLIGISSYYLICRRIPIDQSVGQSVTVGLLRMFYDTYTGFY